MVSPSWEISMLSIATSLASDFISVELILVGQALFKVHVMVGSPLSSQSLMTTFCLSMVFILILVYQSQNLLSLLKTPFFMVTLLFLTIPGILMVENMGLFPCLYSICCA